MGYHGGEAATVPLVRRYLAENYTNADGSELDERRLDALLAEHDDVVQSGVRALSYANYVGDRIAELAGLHADPDDDEEEVA